PAQGIRQGEPGPGTDQAGQHHPAGPVVLGLEHQRERVDGGTRPVHGLGRRLVAQPADEGNHHGLLNRALGAWLHGAADGSVAPVPDWSAEGALLAFTEPNLAVAVRRQSTATSASIS